MAMISLKNGKFLIPTPHYNFCIVQWYIEMLRDDGLRRGFDALDVERKGEIPVEKFKERIRKVFTYSRMEPHKYQWLKLQYWYSTPDLVPDRTEELNARPFAEKKVSCLKQSFSIFHYLCSGISVFVQRRNLGTTGAEQPSPCLRSPKVGELLTLSPVWALDFPAQLISYLSIWKKSYFCRRVHYKQPPQQPRIMSDTSFEILP